MGLPLSRLLRVWIHLKQLWRGLRLLIKPAEVQISWLFLWIGCLCPGLCWCSILSFFFFSSFGLPIWSLTVFSISNLPVAETKKAECRHWVLRCLMSLFKVTPAPRNNGTSNRVLIKWSTESKLLHLQWYSWFACQYPTRHNKTNLSVLIHWFVSYGDKLGWRPSLPLPPGARIYSGRHTGIVPMKTHFMSTQCIYLPKVRTLSELPPPEWGTGFPLSRCMVVGQSTELGPVPTQINISCWSVSPAPHTLRFIMKKTR